MQPDSCLLSAAECGWPGREGRPAVRQERRRARQLLQRSLRQVPLCGAYRSLRRRTRGQNGYAAAVPQGQMPSVSEAVRGHVMKLLQSGRQAFSRNLDLPSA